jgi:membrane-associated phospholipid phosphatase
MELAAAATPSGSAGRGRGSRLAPARTMVVRQEMTKAAPQREHEANGPSRTSGESFLADPAHALWAAGAMLALVALIAILVPVGPLELDRSWSEAMRHLETPLLTHLALVFNWLGRGLGRALSLALIGLLLLRRRRWLALGAFAVAECLAPLLSALLKTLVDRARPPDGLVHPVGASFPSGHATYGGATCVALVLLFTTAGTRRRWWWALASLGIVGMAWSRTYLQVHWLTDVVAGALLGSGVSLLVFAIAQVRESAYRRGRAGVSGQQRAANASNEATQRCGHREPRPGNACHQRHPRPVVVDAAMIEVACHAGGRGFEFRRSRTRDLPANGIFCCPSRRNQCASGQQKGSIKRPNPDKKSLLIPGVWREPLPCCS